MPSLLNTLTGLILWEHDILYIWISWRLDACMRRSALTIYRCNQLMVWCMDQACTRCNVLAIWSGIKLDSDPRDACCNQAARSTSVRDAGSVAREPNIDRRIREIDDDREESCAAMAARLKGGEMERRPQEDDLFELRSIDVFFPDLSWAHTFSLLSCTRFVGLTYWQDA